ncbi:MAG: bifunctional 3,4-dihydroxy-2-butanone-4-phosphate synthase/GTP cyclohydrolase II, partial [Gallionella sp.]|nr:bifunctional 3,4-dihydroxy-2-butanone-4-phosphate synthase/GTP cyclohydrolase II [Gallionella sp.]
EYAKQHGLKIGTIADLIHYRSETESLVARVAEKQVNTPYGEFKLVTYLDKTANEIHLALVKGEIKPGEEILVRVHEPLSVMDFLDVSTLEHSFSVHQAMETINQAGCGVIVLMRRTESAEDLLERIQRTTAKPPAKVDLRNYGIGAQMLRDIGVTRMRLLAVPRKMPSMVGFDLEVTGYVSPEKA